jgi:hypothetical protein
MDLPTIKFASGDSDMACDITITIKNSAIDLQCDMNRYERKDLEYVHKVAYDLARGAVNIMAFATGITLTVIFDQLINVDGTVSSFVCHTPDHAALCTAYELKLNETPRDFGEILKIILTEPALFLALDDLITSTSLHHLITVNSARAIEGLRHAMAPPGISRSQAWELFRTNLNITHNYLRLITDQSQSGRHGENKHVPGTITTEIGRRSWTVMNRFLEFRKRGNQRLPLAEFPLLTG